MIEEYTEEEAIQLAIDEGLTDGRERQTVFYENRGYINSGNNLTTFIEKLEQKYETVKLKLNPQSNGGKGDRPYAGKRRRYLIGNERNEFVKRIDKRQFGIGKRKTAVGYAVALTQRPDYDPEFRDYIREKYNTYRISRQMILLEYGHNTYAHPLPLSTKESTKIKRLHGNYIYRFCNKNKEVIYVGLTKEIGGRMYHHFNNGHLNEDAYEETDAIEYVEVGCETTMNLLEIYLINKYKPKYNSRRKYNGFERIEYFEQISSNWKNLSV